MTDRKPAKLEFTDCLGCGKRVATTATICRHCNTVRLPVGTLERTSDDDDLESHAALGYGGYDNHDLDEEELDSSTKKNLWWYVAWVLLVVFLLSALVPMWL